MVTSVAPSSAGFGAIGRLRLLTALDHGSPLVALVAPPGFGKTTLLRQWRTHRADADPAAVTTVSVQLTGPTDDTQFWQAVLAAMTRAGRAPSGSPAERRAPRSAVEQFLHTLDVVPLLIVDGLEWCTDHHASHALLDLLDDGALTQVAVSFRSHIQYLRTAVAAHAAVLITAEDLRFTPTDLGPLDASAPAHDTARDSSADTQADVDVATVLATTGGWPAPTAALLSELRRSGSLRSAQDRARDAVTALLREQSPDASTGRLDAIAALVRAEEFSTALADQLSTQPSAGHIAWLTEAGLLRTEPGDPPTYRWPETVRAALAHATATVEPANATEAHMLISRWYLQRNEPAPALRHATLAEDWPLITDILEQHARTLLYAHAYQELYQALHRIPLHHIAASPIAVGLRDIWLRVPDHMLYTATALPASPDALDELGRSPQAARTLEAGFVLLMTLGRRGLIDHARVYGTRLLHVTEAARSAQPDKVMQLYPSLHLHAGLLHLVGGDFDSGLRCLWRAYERAGDNPRGYIESDAASKTALAYAMMGDHRRGQVWLNRHAAAPLEPSYLVPRIRCTASAAQLLIAVDQLDLPTAETAHNDVVQADTNSHEIFWAYLAYAETQYAMVTGTAGDMLEQLQRIKGLYQQWLGHGSIAAPLLAAATADLLITLGRGNQARTILSGPLTDHPLMRVSQARLALLTGRTDTALHLATDNNWQRAVTTRHRIDMLLIHAVAAYRGGSHNTAVDALQRAVDTAKLTGTLRPFRTVSAEDLQDIATDLPAAAALLDNPALKAQRDIYPSHVVLIDLTKREQQLLDKLAAGLSVQQIANSLHIAYNTAKVQQRSLYRKLNATNRDAAVARGREYGLLSDRPPPDVA